MGRKIIDIEASGIHPDSYPIEIGIYDIDDETQSRSWLITPHATWTYWDYNAEEIHGLSRQYIEEDGLDALSVCMEVNEIISKENVYSDAPSYEIMWLVKLFDTFNVPFPDTVLDVCHLIPFDNMDSFFRELNAQRRPHRALADAVMIGHCVKQHIGEK